MKPVFEEILGPKVLPEDLDFYQLMVDTETCEFISVATLVPKYTYDPAVPFFNILVPTNETTMQRFLVSTLVRGGGVVDLGYSVLFAGDTGVGKSVGIQMFLNTCNSHCEEGTVEFQTCTTNFSAQTSSANVVDFFENSLEKRRKNLLGAAPGCKFLIFIDDINMPLVEKYGAQPPIELLRQTMDQVS